MLVLHTPFVMRFHQILLTFSLWRRDL